MKTVFIICTIFATFGVCVKAIRDPNDREDEIRGAIEDRINNTLNEIIEELPEPLAIDNISVELPGTTNLPEAVLQGGLSVTDLRISGVKSIVASYIKVDLLKTLVNLTIDIPEVYITTKWWADMTLLELVPLYGDGRMSFTFENVQWQIAGNIGLIDGINLKNLRVVTLIGDAVFDLHGLINNEEFSALVSAALNDNFVNFMNEYQELVTDIISPVLEVVINAILSGQNTTLALENNGVALKDGQQVTSSKFVAKELQYKP